jgi:hypothetical protein
MRRLLKPCTIAYLIAFGVVAILFWITLCSRIGFASEVTNARTELVTAQLYFWLQNWIHNGAFSIHFTMPYLPLSIESPGLQFRSELYRSYPPGTLIPVYLVSLLYGSSPITVLTGYDLACHAVVVAAILTTVFIAVAAAARAVLPADSAASQSAPALLAISAGIFATVASGPAYFFTRVYVWDVAVIPWFALALLLEAIYATNRNSPRWASIALACQMLVFTAGLWTDWLFVLVIFVWLAIRVVEPLFVARGAIAASRSCGLASLTFIVNLALIIAWSISAGIDQSGDGTVWSELRRIGYKMIYRAGLTNEDPITPRGFFQQINDYFFLYFSIYLWQFLLVVSASLLCVLVTLITCRKTRFAAHVWPLASLAALSTLPPVMHICMLPQHSFFHEFSILKFVFPLSLTVLTLAPAAVAVLVAAVFKARFRFSSRTAGAAFCIIAGGAVISGIWFSMTRYDAPQHHFPPIHGGIGTLGTIIGRNTEYADVVFSPQFRIEAMSAEAGFSRKLVYRSSDVDKDLPNVTKNVCMPFNLVLVSDKDDQLKRATPPTERWIDAGLVFNRWRNLQPHGCAGKGS